MCVATGYEAGFLHLQTTIEKSPRKREVALTRVVPPSLVHNHRNHHQATSPSDLYCLILRPVSQPASMSHMGSRVDCGSGRQMRKQIVSSGYGPRPSGLALGGRASDSQSMAEVRSKPPQRELRTK